LPVGITEEELNAVEEREDESAMDSEEEQVHKLQQLEQGINNQIKM